MSSIDKFIVLKIRSDNGPLVVSGVVLDQSERSIVLEVESTSWKGITTKRSVNITRDRIIKILSA